MDTKPRRMDAESCMILNNLSEMVVRELEKDVYLSQQRQQAQQLQQLNVGLLRANGQLQGGSHGGGHLWQGRVDS